MKEKYYTASEAQEKLGLSRAVFFRKANLGLIPKVVPPGMKRGLYPKRDIDALAYSMKLEGGQDSKIVFSQSTPADQIEEMSISVRCFGRNFISSLPNRIVFQQKAEYTFNSLKVDNRVVGYVSMFRFSQVFLDSLLSGTKVGNDISVKDVKPFTRREPFDVYIDSIAIDPEVPAHLRALWAGILIARFTDFIGELKTNGYEINRVYTVVSTPDGERLVKKLGFQRVNENAPVQNRTAFYFPFDDAHFSTLKKLTTRGRIYGL